MSYTYVLISKNGQKTYTGCTANLLHRLKEHNEGKVKSSLPYAPYEILHFEEFITLREARKQELYLKSTSGRRKIKELICERSVNRSWL